MIAYKVKLKLNNKQKSICYQYARASHFAYNWCLEKQETNYKNGGKFIRFNDILKQFTLYKKQNMWLYNIQNYVLKQSIKHCCDAYLWFFKKLAKRPCYKSKKKSKLSFEQRTDSGFHLFENNRVQLSGLGIVKYYNKNYIPLNKKYYCVTISSNDYGNSWYMSLVVDETQTIRQFKQDGIGIDLGLKDLAILNDGTKFENINKTARVKKLEKRLKHISRAINRKYVKNKQGNKFIKTRNIIKQELKIKKQWEHITNIRDNYINNVVSNIIKREPSFVVMEELNIKWLSKNSKLSKAVLDNKLYTLRNKIKNKLELTSSQFILADKFFPSSKMCSKCGNIKKNLHLENRVYKCECGYTEDRDVNASINLYNYGLKKISKLKNKLVV